ncbi:Olfactory receptor 52A1 [Heterocephalus glaber]|uniref:Olfactory receptor 52A1 n=1 Tax=Heterocephalus glaber TaxID=10181 RepID=G5B9I2_HETGA|nr:Olfactory receptor 52A1 [Heterocephalus glaber]
MRSTNMSYLNPRTVILIGIPELENVQFWIGFPFFALCLVGLLGNILLLIIIPMERSLHQPTYIFLAVLAATDLGLCVAIAPKMLAIFWFGSCSMAFDTCLTQLFFVHALQGMESGMLLAMAFDCYIAICHPLRHTSILTPFFLVQVVLMAAIWATVLVGILPILLRQLKLFHSLVIVHSYCEHMAVVKMAAEDVYINKSYGLFVAFAILGHRFGHVSPYVHILLSTIYLLVPPAFNPIVYAVKTKDIRIKVAQVFMLKLDTQQ